MSNNLPPIPQSKIEENHNWREWFFNLRTFVNNIQMGVVTIFASNIFGYPNDVTKVLKGDGTWATVAGTGDVVGPAGAVSGNVAIYDGATGKLLKDTGTVVSGSNTGDSAVNSRYEYSTKIPGMDGLDGEDGWPGPVGPQGIQGVAGVNGTIGVNGAPGQDGEDGQDSWPTNTNPPTQWPMLKTGVELGETMTIPPNFQYLIKGPFTNRGTIENRGILVIL